MAGARIGLAPRTLTGRLTATLALVAIVGLGAGVALEARHGASVVERQERDRIHAIAATLAPTIASVLPGSRKKPSTGASC